MTQQIQPQQLTAQWFEYVVPVIFAVWVGTFVLSQVVKIAKGEEVEKPPFIPK